jgi:carboxymethylenebutenolidase
LPAAKRTILPFAAALVAAQILSQGLAGSAEARPPYRVNDDSGASGMVTCQADGRSVPMEVFPARHAGPGPVPAVMILHGASGIGHGDMIYPYARAISAAGMTAYVVHYFDGIEPRHAGHPAGAGLYAERKRILETALQYIAARPTTDRNHIGVFGLSLGGFHALGLGVEDKRVRAVVDVFGALPQQIHPADVRGMPPVLILHGESDRVVPVSKARTLVADLERVGASFMAKFYPGQGHVFRGAVLDDSVKRTAAFFHQHLMSPTPTPVLRVAAM